MLVLSRRETESVRFPDLDITIEVLRIKGQSIRLGIDAPVEIKVLRGELQDQGHDKLTRRIAIQGESDHEIRNKISTLNLAIALAEKHIQSGRMEQAANVLAKTISNLEKNECDAQPSVPAIEPSNEKQSLHALLVEDVDNERTMLAGFLQLHGFKVDSVNDGEQAIAYLEENQKPDLILMDMHMPNLDGPSTIEMIRSNPAFDKVEIFAVSGQTPEYAGVDTSKNRISHWFQKPLQPKALVSRIKQRVESAALN